MEFRNVTSDDVAFRVYPPLFEAYVVDLHNKRCMTQKLWPQFFAKQPNRTLKPGNLIFMLDSVNVHSLPHGQYTLSIHTLMLRNIASEEPAQPRRPVRFVPDRSVASLRLGSAAESHLRR